MLQKRLRKARKPRHKVRVVLVQKCEDCDCWVVLKATAVQHSVHETLAEASAAQDAIFFADQEHPEQAPVRVTAHVDFADWGEVRAFAPPFHA